MFWRAALVHEAVALGRASHRLLLLAHAGERTNVLRLTLLLLLSLLHGLLLLHLHLLLLAHHSSTLLLRVGGLLLLLLLLHGLLLAHHGRTLLLLVRGLLLLLLVHLAALHRLTLLAHHLLLLRRRHRLALRTLTRGHVVGLVLDVELANLLRALRPIRPR